MLSSRRVHIIGVLFLTGATFAVSLGGGFVWDDFHLIVNNTLLQSPGYVSHVLFGDFWNTTTLWTMEHASNRGIYRPVVSLAYWAQYQLFGLNAFAFHLVSLALHLLCVWLVFRWLERRFAAEGTTASLAVAAGTLVFALHPSRAESVAWISGSTDLWMCVWILLGVEAWDRVTGRAGTILTGIAFTLAFLSKEVAVVAPALLLIDAWLRPSARPVVARARMRRAAVLLGAIVAIAALRVIVIPLPTDSILATGIGGLLHRVTTTLGGFVMLVVWPWPASTQVGFLPSGLTGAEVIYPQVPFYVGLLAWSAIVALGVRAARHPPLRRWLADLAWFLLPIAPLLNIAAYSQISYLSERYLYAAGIGLAALVARAMAHAISRRSRLQVTALVVAGVLLIAYAAGSAVHARHFASSDALWSYEYERDAGNIFALSNLLQTRFEQRRLGEAKALSLRWLERHPRAEDKAHAFSIWLAIETEEAITHPLRLRQLQRHYDKIVAGEELEGVDREIFARVPPAGRRWLQQSPLLHLRRAIVALHARDYAAADAQLQVLSDDSRVGVAALRPWILLAVLQGRADAAAQRLQEYRRREPSPEAAAQLERFVAEGRRISDSTATPAGRIVAMVENLLAAGEIDAARSLLMAASDDDPVNEELHAARARLALEP